MDLIDRLILSGKGRAKEKVLPAVLVDDESSPLFNPRSLDWIFPLSLFLTVFEHSSVLFDGIDG